MEKKEEVKIKEEEDANGVRTYKTGPYIRLMRRQKKINLKKRGKGKREERKNEQKRYEKNRERKEKQKEGKGKKVEIKGNH